MKHPIIQKSLYQDAIVFKTVTPSTIEYNNMIKLREDILRKPLGLQYTKLDLEEEKGCMNIAGYIGDQLVCTCAMRFSPSKIQVIRVAVTERQQGKGLGTLIMDYCENYARECEAPLIFVHSRSLVRGFYSDRGYIPEGELFWSVGIPHIKMVKRFNYPENL